MGRLLSDGCTRTVALRQSLWDDFSEIIGDGCSGTVALGR